MEKQTFLSYRKYKLRIKNNSFLIIYVLNVLHLYVYLVPVGCHHFGKIDLFAFAMNSLRTTIKINELNLFCTEFRSINFRHVGNSDRGKQKFNQIRSNKLACASTSNLYSHKTSEWHLKAIPLSILSYSTIRPIYIFMDDLERILRKIKSIQVSSTQMEQIKAKPSKPAPIWLS